MTATTVDLRYRTHDILRSLEHFESILITRRGKPVGTIIPFAATERKGEADLRKNPFFGCDESSGETVEEEMARLRGGRF